MELKTQSAQKAPLEKQNTISIQSVEENTQNDTTEEHSKASHTQMKLEPQSFDIFNKSLIQRQEKKSSSQINKVAEHEFSVK